MEKLFVWQINAEILASERGQKSDAAAHGRSRFLFIEFFEDQMKRTTRLSIEVFRQDVKLSLDGSMGCLPMAKRTPVSTTVACPNCGCPWIAVVAQTERDAPADLDRLHRSLHHWGLHSQISPAGQLRICQSSLEEIQERF